MAQQFKALGWGGDGGGMAVKACLVSGVLSSASDPGLTLLKTKIVHFATL